MIPLEKVEALPFHIRFTIPEDYLDMFGHMNIQFYIKLFNDSIFVMCADYGMDTAYFQQSNYGMFASEQHIKYLREVHVGDTIATYSRFFARSDKRLHFMHFMVNETQQTLASTIEILALHVNREARKSAAFPETLAAQLDECIAAHNALRLGCTTLEAFGGLAKKGDTVSPLLVTCYFLLVTSLTSQFQWPVFHG